MSNEEEQEEDEDGDLSLLTGLGGRRQHEHGDSGYCNLVRQDRHQQHHSSYRPREVGCFEQRSGQNVGITKSLEAAEAAQILKGVKLIILDFWASKGT